MAQAKATNQDARDKLEIRKNATIYAIKLNNEKIEEAKSEVAARVVAKAKYEECDNSLWKFEEEFRKAEDDEQLFKDNKADLEKRLTSLIGNAISSEKLSSGLNAA